VAVLQDLQLENGALLLWGSLAALTAALIFALRARFHVTRRLRAEQDFERLYALSRDLCCFAGFDGCFHKLNPAWETLLGYSREELVSRPFLDFVHPADRDRTAAETTRLLHGEEVVSFENRYVARDGTCRWLSWNARSSPSEKIIYATARDITQEKRTQEEIARLHTALQARAAELESANRELEAFSYSVSHDLRTPLRHINAFISLLRKSAEAGMSEECRHYLQVIVQSAEQMGNLIDDLLVFSRNSRVELQHGIVSLQTMIPNIIDMFETEAGSRRVTWKTDGLPDIPGDPALLRQVFVNLISNALKYTRPREEAHIEIGQVEDPQEFIIFVRDNGVGFEMEYVHKLFGVFQRLHGPDEFEGTGVGLANVRQIIQRHGGRVWADGKVDEGATFYFSLPKELNKRAA
jgi:PAS domain S-box-containing protein